MKRKLLIGIIILLVILGFGLFALITMMDHTYWGLISETDSPNGKYTIYEYSYTSDGDRHAPYGTYLFINPSYIYEKNPINSHVIFAGYCSNKKIYKWLSNNQIDISCQAIGNDSIRTQSVKAYGIKINVVSVLAKTHNKHFKADAQKTARPLN